jgi:nucleoid-associated protein YgaU
LVGHADTVPAGAGQTYTVQKGDTLSAIAQRHYGKASRWHAVFEANRDQLDDPDKIQPGQVLNLPPE